MVLPAYDFEAPESTFVGLASSPIPITRVAPRPITAQVSNLPTTDMDDAVEDSEPIIQAALFGLAFIYNLGFETTSDLYRRRNRPRYRTSPSVPISELTVPKGRYNADLVRFYVRATASTDPVIQFLSYYHVLEFFFVQLSDEQLYAKLRALVLTPGFRPTTSRLDLT
jgi:hypothetical protein